MHYFLSILPELFSIVTSQDILNDILRFGLGAPTRVAGLQLPIIYKHCLLILIEDVSKSMGTIACSARLLDTVVPTRPLC